MVGSSRVIASSVRIADAPSHLEVSSCAVSVIAASSASKPVALRQKPSASRAGGLGHGLGERGTVDRNGEGVSWRQGSGGSKDRGGTRNRRGRNSPGTANNDRIPSSPPSPFKELRPVVHAARWLSVSMVRPGRLYASQARSRARRPSVSLSASMISVSTSDGMVIWWNRLAPMVAQA